MAEKIFEALVTKNTLFIIAMTLSIIASLFFVAGAETFALLPANIANFAGIAAGGAAAVFWLLYARGGNGG